MFADETELKKDVREMTGYPAEVLSDDGLDAAYRNARRHIEIKKSLAEDYVWFRPDNPAAQDALYWWTCLFSKVQTGELDSQGLQAGAVDQDTLLAKEGDDVTMWYRQASSALQSVSSSTIIQGTSPSRTGRAYEAGSFETGGNSSGGSGGTEVDSTDI